MLRNIKDLEHFTIGAADGAIGRITDFYFDDEAWVIRYLVVDTEETTPRRSVLISPIAIGQPDWSEQVFPTALTMAQVKGSPDIDTHKPVSRQQEMGYSGYYGYGNYWGGGGLWGAGLYPDILQAGRQAKESSVADRSARLHQAHRGVEPAAAQGSAAAQGRFDDSHLRSGNGVMRYYVHATDGDIGHVDGLLIDEKSWAIRYIVVNTSNWWLGHQVIISPQWIDEVSWAESTVSVDLTRQAIKDSPPYDVALPPDREQEANIHRHYGRKILQPGEVRGDRVRVGESRESV
jgi:hypothetical protein